MMQKAATCLWAYDNLYDSSKRQFHCFLQGSCNPEVLYYADSKVFLGEDNIQKGLTEMKVRWVGGGGMCNINNSPMRHFVIIFVLFTVIVTNAVGNVEH